MLAILAALAAATSNAPFSGPPAPVSIDEARHALSNGRFDQAQTMLANALAGGAHGEPIDRLRADLAFAKHDDVLALSIYQTILPTHPDDPAILERAGIAELRLGAVREATALLRRATAHPDGGWRAWNALGAAGDARGDWAEADTAYARALTLAPDRAEIANNYGWSLALRGRWHEAQAELSRGFGLDPTLPRLANNLQLARDALASSLPERRVGENDSAWAARLNDTGVVAAAQGERARAIAAFAQSIAARPAWNARTAANLAAVKAGP
jgi:tetratricopeptide (TPR) repeat protein